jgi:Kelch motif
MSYPRMHLNAVLLADGTVFVTGGGRKREYGRPVKAAELFDPLTETWTTVAAQRAPRAYHSTAVLLPDGRVLSAGHDNGRRSTMAEVYSPPYLFRGARPTIASSIDGVNFDHRYVDRFLSSGRRDAVRHGSIHARDGASRLLHAVHSQLARRAVGGHLGSSQLRPVVVLGPGIERCIGGFVDRHVARAFRRMLPFFSLACVALVVQTRLGQIGCLFVHDNASFAQAPSRGTTTLIRHPRGERGSTQMSPPWRSTIQRAMARPRPLPPSLLDRARSDR